MTIELLPSGSYRITQMYNGKRYRITLDHKPTKKEATILVAEKLQEIEEGINGGRDSFQSHAEKFMKDRSNIFSPSTLYGYDSNLKNLSKDFTKLKIGSITQQDIQKEINRLSEKKSPKTVRNYYGFISSVMKYARPKFSFHVDLPQKEKVDSYMPQDDEIKKVLEASKDTVYYIPLLLAVYGLRRSEVLAINPQTDLDGNMLTINKAKVRNKEGVFIIKNYNKTTESHRTIYIDDYLCNLIRDKDSIFEGHPECILEHLHRVQKQLDLPKFTLHSFRYYYVSMAHSLGIPDKYIQESGGWSGTDTMNKVYKRSYDKTKVEMQQFASQYITELL